MRALSHGDCAICKKQNSLIQLHDDNGGPWVCPVCAGKWHAEHGRRRKAGRVVIRAIIAYKAAGGKWSDVDKLKNSALHGFGNEPWHALDPLGYMADAIDSKGEITDLTTELLDDAVRLTHPDCHPLERQELAHRVTQELLALKPFAFPKPPPPPPPKPYAEEVQPAPRDDFAKSLGEKFAKALQYPCSECRSTVPYFYCTTCKAEWNKRNKAERERNIAYQRTWRAKQKARRAAIVCGTCGVRFKGKRKDAKFCSSTCRQRAFRGRAIVAPAAVCEAAP